MLFVLITIVFVFIFIISFFGDYKSKEIEKDYKKYEEILKIKEEK